MGTRQPNRRVPRRPVKKSGGGGNQLLILVLILLAVLWAVLFFTNKDDGKVESLRYSEFMEKVEQGTVKRVTIVESDITGIYDEMPNGRSDEREFSTYIPYAAGDLVETLLERGVEVTGKPKENSWLPVILINVVPILIFALFIWFFMFRQVQGSNNRAMSFGKSPARRMTKETVKVTFGDVEGCEEAKVELQEVVDFLKDPAKFTRIGAKIPKGVLLVGPPGTGKTLLAKAIAGEAHVPFFSMSGSEFVEMFVGVGASRVRDLFEKGKREAPCLIFIDELDAVGRTRGAGYGGGHDEREQTLNQMLVEMDGFDTNASVIIIAATNRPDVLDPALLRPGRFDRQVVVDNPDIKGREGILLIHAKKIKHDSSVDFKSIARATPGFSGADLANLVNEAAILAGRRNKNEASMAEFEEARDKVMMGPERRSLVISEKELKNTAYHEAGHTLVAAMLKENDALHKVTIIPRGKSLGSTWTMPTDGRYTISVKKALDTVAMLLAGRASEAYKFGEDEVTTGASNDIERATELVHRMVCEWGMSPLGPLAYGQKEQPIFLGKEIARHKDYSEETAKKLDAQIYRVVMEQYERAKGIISEHSDKLEQMVEELMTKEILDSLDLERILGIPIRKEGERMVSLKNGIRVYTDEDPEEKDEPKKVASVEKDDNMLDEKEGGVDEEYSEGENEDIS